MSQAQHPIDWSDSAICAFDVAAREFVVVTADAADLRSFTPLCALLRRVRKAFGVTAAFICEGADGETFVRHRDTDDQSAPDELQSLYGMRLLAVGAPESVRHSYVAVPVITRDGIEHGTFCCRFACEGAAWDQHALGSLARLIADWFDEAELSLSDFAPLSGTTVMGSLSAVAH